jgi:hypothetical protein
VNTVPNLEFVIDNPPDGAWIRRTDNNLVIGATAKSILNAILFSTSAVAFSIIALLGLRFIFEDKGVLTGILVLGLCVLAGLLIFCALLAINGRVEIVLNHSQGMIFTGIGRLGITKKFLLDSITSVEIASYSTSDGVTTYLELRGEKTIRMGSFLTGERMEYLKNVLELILAAKKGKIDFLISDL